MSIEKLAQKYWKKLIAPLAYAKNSLGGRYEQKGTSKIITGHWHEDGSPFEIECPSQLAPILCEVLNNLHLTEVKEK